MNIVKSFKQTIKGLNNKIKFQCRCPLHSQTIHIMKLIKQNFSRMKYSNRKFLIYKNKSLSYYSETKK